ncbi:bZIP transcription factor 11-like [Brachypodium distachyon]|uniref:BZIP domain-containing protein n=1 Tax=Brachypodium distachyon TaxID=15368 RepID=I1HNE2_BRADI|nr:bZIP transcription factor 11-like [Brachypodium distachyon]PNT72170.1 hypothetical protein BRADI_2g40582v3 [Brachypodium distachyon]|eukprot:XP_024315686.1 bZIP transcription factor 11-like [Brachypodium distachyon]
MASPGITTSSAGSVGAATPAVALTEERKRKRKESNRLSAQRSRARKQRQVDDLEAQVAAMRARNCAMAAAANEAERLCAAVQAENALLSARALELSARLESLTDLIQCMDAVMYSNNNTNNNSYYY